MSDSDKAVVESQIRAQWPGEYFTPKRGHFHVPPVRDGGATDLCIKLAAEIADAHYRKVIAQLVRGVANEEVWVKIFGWLGER